MAKHIFVTGGVVSSLGKGITAASLGHLLKARGYQVTMQKMDPYLNVDPGTMSPFQHGEVFVTEDGHEGDLDLGHYERFIDENLTRESNFTQGSIYQSLIARERRGDYLGGTVQVIPHVTEAIKARLRRIADQTGADIVISEIGGTVGDIESLPFIEAARQFKKELPYGDVLFVHVTLVPYIAAAHEVKTKPTQHSVKELRSIGVQPDFIVCRSDHEIEDGVREKIALFCDVRPEEVLVCTDAPSIYEVPLGLHEQRFDEMVLDRLCLYSLPIALGLAFSVWGLYFWMKGRASAGPEKWYLAGSLCMALVAGCRPQLLVLSLVAFPLFWRAYITKRRLLTPRGAREFACLIAPYLVVAAGLMAYNHARFGSFTDFGANYNLTVNDMTKRGWNIGRLAPALFAYFLQPPSATGVFPYLQPAPFDTTYMGQTIKEVTFGGIFACLPVLWVLPFAKRVLQLRMSQRSTRTIAGVIVVLLLGGVIVALADAEMAGILQRYFADFSFMFLAAVVLLVFIVNENLQPGSTVQNLLMKVLLVLVAVSVLYSALLCFVPETGWYSDVYPWAYRDIIETAQFWT